MDQCIEIWELWRIIVRRMKHNHSCWSEKGVNNLAKKCSGKLNEIVAKLKMPVFEQSIVQKIESDILMAGQVKKKTGKGYEYPVQGSLINLYESVKANTRQAWEYFDGV